MIPSITKKTISLAISLLVVVISLTGVALAANAPTVNLALTTPRYTPGFAGTPGKMARDAAGNFYVTDFWGKRIVKLDRNGANPGFISTKGRPSAVAVLPDNRLVVAMAAPEAYVAFYEQTGSLPNVSGAESSTRFTVGGVAFYRPIAITVDDVGRIYVLDSGDNTGNMDVYNTSIETPASIYGPNVKVFSPTGVWLHEFGTKTYPSLVNLANTNLGRFKQPQGIAFEKAATQIVVADTQNHRLQYFGSCTNSSCTPVKGIGSTTIGVDGSPPAVLQTVRFYNPSDVAFEYDNSNVLQRVYVAEKAQNQITVFDPANDFFLSGINSGAALKLPASLLFESTATGYPFGVLYSANAATSTPANIRVLGIDGGIVPQPVLTMAFDPPVAATTPGTSLNISGTSTPAGSAAAVTCKVNGVARGTVVGTSSWTTNPGGTALTLNANALNYILCQSISGGVTSYAEATTFSGTDPTVVTVAVSSPTAATLYSNNPDLKTVGKGLTVTGTTNLGNATVQLVINPGNTTLTTQSDANGNWNKTVVLAEGSNSLAVTAWKPGTAVSAQVNRTVVVDTVAPNMTNTISFLADGSTTTSAVQNLDGIVFDLNPLQSITVNGVPVSANAKVALAGNNTYFSVPVILERGINTVTVLATDLAGNSTPISRSVTLAPEKPVFTLAPLLVDNKFRATDSAESSSGTYDTTYASVSACGTSATLTAGNWSASIPSIGAGFVSCQFTASGGGNTTVNEKRTYNTTGTYNSTVITHALVAITSPATDKATNVSTIDMTGSVTANTVATPQVTLNGISLGNVTTYVPATGAFTFKPGTGTTLTPGLNTVKITSNGTTTIRNIIYDTTAPDLTILADSKPMPASISGSIDPNAKLSVTTWVGSTPTVVTDPTRITFDLYDQFVWHVSVTGLVYDKITFTATDPAGNAYPLDYVKGIPTGDIDGDGTVRLADALAALRHVANTEAIAINTDKFFSGDVGSLVQGKVARDGIIDITDAVLILNKAYGLMVF